MVHWDYSWHGGWNCDWFVVGSVVSMSRWMVAWTILKLKVTRSILSVVMRLHLWDELRNQRKVQPSYKEGQRTREEVREAVRQVKKKRK